MRLESADVIRAALDAGVRLLDTAHAYGESEALVAQALRSWSGERPVVVTKGGLHREGELWKNDARAGTLRAQAEQSLRVLGRIDLFLLHAPDPAVALSTSVRTLAKLKDEGLVSAIGLSNVSLPQLKQALDLAPISAVQVALGAFHQGPFRDGVVAHCLKHGLSARRTLRSAASSARRASRRTPRSPASPLGTAPPRSAWCCRGSSRSASRPSPAPDASRRRARSRPSP